MSLEPSYFDEAADVLKAAFGATSAAEQARLLDEALRLHRLAVAREQASQQQPPPGATSPDNRQA